MLYAVCQTYLFDIHMLNTTVLNLAFSYSFRIQLCKNNDFKETLNLHFSIQAAFHRIREVSPFSFLYAILVGQGHAFYQ